MIELLCEIAAGVFILAMAGVGVAIAVSCTVGVGTDGGKESPTELELDSILQRKPNVGRE